MELSNSGTIMMNEILDTFKAVISTTKRLDILVNCGGVSDGPCWEKEIVTNLVSFAYLFQLRQICKKYLTVMSHEGCEQHHIEIIFVFFI